MSATILEEPFLQGFVRLTDDGFKQGWHERNGGNLSYRLKPEEAESAKQWFRTDSPFVPIGHPVKNLAGEYFLVTGTGKYMRNVVLSPEDNLCIIEIDASGEQYRKVWGLPNGGRPTSEIPTHLLNHSVKKEISHGTHRVIYHAHTTNLIALSFVLPLKAEVFTRELWEMATECPVVFPDGIGVVGWMVPGSVEIGVRTSELMQKYDIVIWAHHGTFASGEDFDLTFGLMHTAEKAAEILVKVLAMGGKQQTITAQNFRDLARGFKVTLPEQFLYEKETARG